MAERPSIKDILAAARKGGPAQPAESAPAAEPQEAAAPETPTAPAPSVPPPAESLGRPLTLKEKLAAARAGAAPAAPSAPAAAAAPPAAAATPAAAPVESEKAVPPPAPSLGRPMSLKEKLAAARGGATPAAATPGAAASATPAAPKAAPAPKAAVARELPPLAEITDPKDLAEALRQAGAKKDKAIAAEKGGAAPPKPAAKPKAEAKTVPGRPSKTAALTEPTRRQLFGVGFWIAAGWTSFTLGTAAFTAMLGRFMFPNVLAEPPSTVKVGVPNDFAKEDVSERWKAEWGFWIVRTERYNGQDIIFAIKSVCTHLGCPPNWLAGEQKFKCPCHGSGFYISGVNFEGPAPRPLERFRVAVADDGQILVDKSQIFQEELAQWSDPDSFLPAV
jgi:cytochrome b6-f complex iron-sulfur subunit